MQLSRNPLADEAEAGGAIAVLKKDVTAVWQEDRGWVDSWSLDQLPSRPVKRADRS